MKEVLFTEDYACYKKGDTFKCTQSLASELVNVEKVAKYKTDKKEVKPKEEK